MSAFKGTPGPWAWGHNSASSDAIHCIEVTAKGRTGSVAYMQSYTTDDYDDRAETIANARLIAAAPELLEACQTALAFVAGWAGFYQHDHGLPDFHPRHKEAIEQVKYAIAKATGGAA